MKSYLPLLFLVFTHLLNAQTYTEVTPPPPFSDINSSSIAWADVDKDGDPDLVVTGKDPKLRGSENRITRLYTNNGDGTFSEAANTPFTGVDHSAIAFTDLNQDGKPDLLITGQTNDESLIAKLYLNTGGSSFEEALNIPFEGVYHSALAVGDLDGSSGPDVLITGFSSNGVRIAKLYLNNGDGTFAKSSATPFEATRDGSVDFADIDNDNDLDVLITGFGSSGSSIARLYTNDGNATFQQVPNPGLTGVHNSAAAFADVNDDDKPDLFITGNPGPTGSISKLYINDGNGGFTETTESTFEGIRNGAVAFFDPDKDGDQDLLIAGVQIPSRTDAIFMARLYENDGSGQFTEVADTPFEGVNNSAIALADINTDGNTDILITGRNTSRAEIKILRLYTVSLDEETEQEPMFLGVHHGTLNVVDVDNDLDLDVLLTGESWGETNYAVARTYLYINDGQANFTLDSRSDFVPRSRGGTDFADVDGDGDQDLLLSGATWEGEARQWALQFVSDLYLNDGSGKFTLVNDTPFEGFESGGFVAFTNLDADDDQDLIMASDTIVDGRKIAFRLYKNNGLGNFKLVRETLADCTNCRSVRLEDMDQDGDKDLLLNGCDEKTNIMYVNDGDFNFRKVTVTQLSGHGVPADIDGDGDLDVLQLANVIYDSPQTSLLIQNENGTYTENPNVPFPDVHAATAAFADLDGDTDLDLFLNGKTGTSDILTTVYRNNGEGIFAEIIGMPNEKALALRLAFADLDDDDDLDLIYCGLKTDPVTSAIFPVTILYLNTGDGTFYEKK